MMKAIFLKTALFVLVFFYSVASFAQTKQETEQWILEKLQYFAKSINGEFIHGETTRDYVGYYFTPRVRIKNGYFEIEKLFRSSLAKDAEEHIFSVEKFPVWAIRHVQLNDRKDFSADLTFYIEDYCKACTVSYLLEGRTNDIKVAASMRFSSADPEENFIERFNKAINHLKTFYPKPKAKKETF